MEWPRFGASDASDYALLLLKVAYSSGNLGQPFCQGSGQAREGAVEGERRLEKMVAEVVSLLISSENLLR